MTYCKNKNRGAELQIDYSREDFDTSKPYEDLLKIEDPFQRGVMIRKVSEYASKKVGFKGFQKAFKEYQESKKRLTQALAPPENFTAFEECELELYTGGWIADDSGVYRFGINGERDFACTHPIQPVERLRNVDTGELKVRLIWRRGTGGRKVFSSITADFDTISNAKNVVSLSKLGISVTSGKRAQNLVDYLADTMDFNYDYIPEKKSVSRLGWNEEGFSPYIGDVVFDGNDAFGRTFSAIHPCGSFDAWLEEARSVRKYSLLARIVLAASFASVLVEPMGCLPFFVHLWGMASETGKTVGQMVAASVWGEPTPGGDYFKTFRSTTVGFEVMAGFLRSLPVIIDELQLTKDARGRVIFNVYELAAGSGKMRSNTKLGIAATPRWANCFITSGETPITGEQDGAGALNRVIEIECLAENKVIENGHKTAEIMKLNYGHAGQMFIEKLCEPGVLEAAKGRYTALYEAYSAAKAADKQSHSAALITLADELATEWIFQDGRQITVSELSGFLKSKEAISAAERGYAYMCDWVAQNANKLRDDPDSIKGERYGLIGESRDDLGWVYIIRAVFYKVCADAGISAPALLSHLRSKGLIQTRGRAFTKNKRVDRIPTECVMMRLKDDPEAEEPEDLPF